MADFSKQGIFICSPFVFNELWANLSIFLLSLKRTTVLSVYLHMCKYISIYENRLINRTLWVLLETSVHVHRIMNRSLETFGNYSYVECKAPSCFKSIKSNTCHLFENVIPLSFHLCPTPVPRFGDSWLINKSSNELHNNYIILLNDTHELNSTNLK